MKRDDFVKTFTQNKQFISTALKIGIPSMVESFFVCLAGLIDSLMVSSLGAEAVAAVGITTQPKFMGLAIFFALNVSVSALVARRYGEKDRTGANGVLITSFAIMLILAAIITAICTVFAPQIISFCGATNETHADAVLYYRIIMGGMIFNCIQMCINSAQRGIGNTKITMWTNLVSNTVNVILNYLLIGGKFGFPALGIRGAALATVLGTVVSSVMSIISVSHSKCFVSFIYIIKNKIAPSLLFVKSIIKIGYGVFFEQILMRVGFMATAIMAANQGTYAMAAHQVAMNILSLSFAFGDGLQSAAVALVGKSLGEKNAENAKNYAKSCQFIGLIITIIMAIFFALSAGWIMSLFFKEAEIIEIGKKLVYMIILVVLFQIRQIIYMGCLRGAGDTLFTAVVASISTTFVRTAVSYVCGYTLGLGIIGIWLGIASDGITKYTCSYFRFKSDKWVNIKI